MTSLEIVLAISAPVVSGAVLALWRTLVALESRVAVLEASATAHHERVDRLETDIVKKLDRLEVKVDRILSQKD